MTTGTVDPTAAANVDAALEIEARSPMQLFWRRLKHDRVAVAAMVVIVILVIVAVFAPLIVRIFGAHPPNEQYKEVLDSFGQARGPGSGWLFGSDDLGRDVFSRVIYGARVSLMVAFISTALTLIIGVTVGMIAGYYRGAVDSIISRSMDVVLAFPVLLLAMGLGAACVISGCLKGRSTGVWLVVLGAALIVLPVIVTWIAGARRGRGLSSVSRDDWILRVAPGVILLLGGLVMTLFLPRSTLIKPGLPLVIFVIVFSGWPYIARIIRGQVLSIREKEYIEAARSLGASDTRIIFRHILPNLVAPIVVYGTLLVPQNILFEAALSFLGIGVVPPTSSWGAMLASATSTYASAWWYMTFPGLALLVTVLAFNLVGDGLQDALNPRGGR